MITKSDLEQILAMLDDSPEYHESGMGCGLEDRDIQNRYEAMRHGWDSAIDRVYGEHVNPAVEAIKAAIEKMDIPAPVDHVRGSNTVAVDRDVLRDIAQLLSGSMFTFISTEEQARARGSELYALLAAAASEGSTDE